MNIELPLPFSKTYIAQKEKPIIAGNAQLTAHQTANREENYLAAINELLERVAGSDFSPTRPVSEIEIEEKIIAEIKLWLEFANVPFVPLTRKTLGFTIVSWPGEKAYKRGLIDSVNNLLSLSFAKLVAVNLRAGNKIEKLPTNSWGSSICAEINKLIDRVEENISYEYIEAYAYIFQAQLIPFEDGKEYFYNKAIEFIHAARKLETLNFPSVPVSPVISFSNWYKKLAPMQTAYEYMGGYKSGKFFQEMDSKEYLQKNVHDEEIRINICLGNFVLDFLSLNKENASAKELEEITKIEKAYNEYKAITNYPIFRNDDDQQARLGIIVANDFFQFVSDQALMIREIRNTAIALEKMKLLKANREGENYIASIEKPQSAEYMSETQKNSITDNLNKIQEKYHHFITDEKIDENYDELEGDIAEKVGLSRVCIFSTSTQITNITFPVFAEELGDLIHFWQIANENKKDLADEINNQQSLRADELREENQASFKNNLEEELIENAGKDREKVYADEYARLDAQMESDFAQLMQDIAIAHSEQQKVIEREIIARETLEKIKLDKEYQREISTALELIGKAQ